MSHRVEDLDRFYSKQDPWGYFSNQHDELRRRVLLKELSRHKARRVLDIGCGNGFVTDAIEADAVLGIDLSAAAIDEANLRSQNTRASYKQASLFDIPSMSLGTFDTILITGVLYEHYIGNSLPLVYRIIDDVLGPEGLLFSVHIEEWYLARFPYPRTALVRYPYREYMHLFEVYRS